MAGELNITIIGRLTDAPELRFTPSGSAVANFTIAQNARIFDKNSNEWKDKATNFFRCTIWREAAENVAESLLKGMEVIAFGEVTSRSYETKEGQQRTVQEIELQHIGPSLRTATAKVTRTAKSEPAASARNTPNQGGWGGGNTQSGNNVPGQDPWATPQTSDAWSNGPQDPPF